MRHPSLLHFVQAQAGWDPDAEVGVDVDGFRFPAIDEQSTLYAGEFIVAFRNDPEVVDFITKFSGEEVQCARAATSPAHGSRPTSTVGADCYANEVLADSAEILMEALASDAGRFDAPDLMPPQVQEAFWADMMTYMQQGPASLSGVLEDIEGG